MISTVEDLLEDNFIPSNLVTLSGSRFYVSPDVTEELKLAANAPQLGHKSIIRNVGQLKQVLATLDDDLPVGFSLEEQQALAIWMYRNADARLWLIFEPEEV